MLHRKFRFFNKALKQTPQIPLIYFYFRTRMKGLVCFISYLPKAVLIHASEFRSYLLPNQDTCSTNRVFQLYSNFCSVKRKRYLNSSFCVTNFTNSSTGEIHGQFVMGKAAFKSLFDTCISRSAKLTHTIHFGLK